MTVIPIGNDYTGYVAIGSGNSYIVTDGALLAHDFNAFNFAETFSQTLVVNGSIVAESDGVTSASASSYNSVTVNTNGSVVGLSDGIELAGFNHAVVNHGAITGHGDSGVEFEGDYAALSNFGSIHGLQGVYIYGGNAHVSNSGEIHAESYQGVVLSGAAGQSNVLQNSGVIASGGTVAPAVQGGSSDETVENSGSILGDVVLYGGDDIFDGRGGTVNGQILGGEGDDTYIIDDAGFSLVELGGEGTDEVQSTVDYALAAHFETLTLLGGEGLVGWGNYQANTLNGNDAANVLRGMAGNDTINGNGGDDLIYGGDGDDDLSGHHGNDRIYAGAGNDNLIGHVGNDNLLGEWGNDVIQGGGGDDSMLGGDGNDVLHGGGDNDTILGGAGFDTIRGSTGDDLMTGNFNADTFLFSDGFGNDTITDFAATNDFEVIDLSGVSSIINFGDLAGGHMSQVGANVVIDAGGGDVITLLNVNLAQLDANDFVF